MPNLSLSSSMPRVLLSIYDATQARLVRYVIGTSASLRSQNVTGKEYTSVGIPRVNLILFKTDCSELSMPGIKVRSSFFPRTYTLGTSSIN